MNTIPKRETFPMAPFLIICDTSLSMTEGDESVKGAEPPIKALARGLPDMLEELHANKRVREIAALSLLAFDEDVKPLTNFGYLGALGKELSNVKLTVSGRHTDYEPPLWYAYDILQHIPRLTDSCYRPVIFWISDGGHNTGSSDGWREARRQLIHKDFFFRPTICTFAIGSRAAHDNLSQLASSPDLAQHWDAHTGEAMQLILNTVVRTSTALSQPHRDQRAGDQETELWQRVARFRYDDDVRADDLGWDPDGQVALEARG